MTKQEFYDKVRDGIQQQIWGDEMEQRLVQRYMITDPKKDVGKGVTAEQMAGLLTEKLKVNKDRLDVIKNI